MSLREKVRRARFSNRGLKDYQNKNAMRDFTLFTSLKADDKKRPKAHFQGLSESAPERRDDRPSQTPLP